MVAQKLCCNVEVPNVENQSLEFNVDLLFLVNEKSYSTGTDFFLQCHARKKADRLLQDICCAV